MPRSQEIVLQSQTLCVTTATASSPTWCATTRPTVLMSQMRWTAVSWNESIRAENNLQATNREILSFSCTDHIFDSPGACDFNMEEESWEERCQLFQDFDGDFDWRIGHETETPGTGPHTDHSPGLNLHFCPSSSRLSKLASGQNEFSEKLCCSS